MSEDLHVLVIPSWYPTHVDDPGGSFFREQAQALARGGLRVGVLTARLTSLRRILRRPFRSHRRTWENDEGIPTLRVSRNAWFPRIAKANERLLIGLGVRAFDEYVAHEGVPDLIHAHSLLHAGRIAREIRKRHRIPYVVTEHSTAFAEGLVSARLRREAMLAAQDAGTRIAVSRPFADLLESFFTPVSSRWEVVPNMVNPSFSRSTPEREEEGGAHFTFVTVSMLVSAKAVSDLVRAFALAFPDESDVHLMICGDGPERRALEKQVSSLGLSDRIHLVGTVARGDVPKRMSSADAFVLASRYETFGVVIVEALAMGLPVIATRSGGPEFIVGPDDGMLVPVGDVEALAEAMVRLRADATNHDAAGLRSRCLARFGEEVVVSRLADIYRRIKADQAGRAE